MARRRVTGGGLPDHHFEAIKMSKFPTTAGHLIYLGRARVLVAACACSSTVELDPEFMFEGS